MRVLHVIPAIADRYGGPSVVAVETVRALRGAGVDAMIATTDADGAERLAVPTGRVIAWQGVPAVVLPLGGGERFKWSGSLARWLSGHVSAFDIVDIHAVFSHSSVAAARACRRSAVPYVVRPHGALDPWSLTRKVWRKRLVLWSGGRRLLAGASFVQYTTAAERAGAEQALPWLPEGHVVPLGVDEGLFAAPAPDAERPYVLTMSRLEAKKSLELLIEAFHDVAMGPLGHWRLVVAGDGDAVYASALRRHAAAGQAAGRIEFPGWVRGDEKRSLLARASLFASPSIQENFGLSLTEAMAAGVPVLVTPGVNLSDAITSAGAGWVVGHGRDVIAAALAHILADATARSTSGQAARQLADRFRWRNSATEVIRLYEAALAPRRSIRHA
ncbi:MAG: glycosyltransferase [Acidobacteria bacterium]|nr:glycosyltransferase [Acidobacteriota bacterium]